MTEIRTLAEQAADQLAKPADQFSCPKCSGAVSYHRSQEAQVIACPHCKARIRIAALPPHPPPPPPDNVTESSGSAFNLRLSLKRASPIILHTLGLIVWFSLLTIVVGVGAMGVLAVVGGLLFAFYKQAGVVGLLLSAILGVLIWIALILRKRCPIPPA